MMCGGKKLKTDSWWAGVKWQVCVLAGKSAEVNVQGTDSKKRRWRDDCSSCRHDNDLQDISKVRWRLVSKERLCYVVLKVSICFYLPEDRLPNTLH